MRNAFEDDQSLPLRTPMHVLRSSYIFSRIVILNPKQGLTMELITGDRSAASSRTMQSTLSGGHHSSR
ncbi:hypothetical protein CH274_14945 [Rhodococcus sp. 06-418-5]|nr:hypothetical protein CH274_14945 [Rhodococcus sp. 06-418-5]OZE37556.1 hypothetical protein CH259_11945 [Rhodococcus sp. 05-2254-4]OZE40688.1 hypothetical protein CH261_26910 [Rhodococcus sp. 05-2254-3]OZE45679.1 hypothetical protein CH283_25565 [Rhodococcus sp. 05-2254-2]